MASVSSDRYATLHNTGTLAKSKRARTPSSNGKTRRPKVSGASRIRPMMVYLCVVLFGPWIGAIYAFFNPKEVVRHELDHGR